MPRTIIELDRQLDGARILYGHSMSQQPPVDGWVREFSMDNQFVRISRSELATDAGTWHRCVHLRVESMLERAKAPAEFREGPTC